MLLQNFTKNVVKKFHKKCCQTISQKMLLKNFTKNVVKIFLPNFFDCAFVYRKKSGQLVFTLYLHYIFSFFLL